MRFLSLMMSNEYHSQSRLELCSFFCSRTRTRETRRLILLRHHRIHTSASRCFLAIRLLITELAAVLTTFPTLLSAGLRSLQVGRVQAHNRWVHRRPCREAHRMGDEREWRGLLGWPLHPRLARLLVPPPLNRRHLILSPSTRSSSRTSGTEAGATWVDPHPPVPAFFSFSSDLLQLLCAGRLLQDRKGEERVRDRRRRGRRPAVPQEPEPHLQRRRRGRRRPEPQALARRPASRYDGCTVAGQLCALPGGAHMLWYFMWHLERKAHAEAAPVRIGSFYIYIYLNAQSACRWCDGISYGAAGGAARFTRSGRPLGPDFRRPNLRRSINQNSDDTLLFMRWGRRLCGSRVGPDRDGGERGGGSSARGRHGKGAATCSLFLCWEMAAATVGEEAIVGRPPGKEAHWL